MQNYNGVLLNNFKNNLWLFQLNFRSIIKPRLFTTSQKRILLRTSTISGKLRSEETVERPQINEIAFDFSGFSNLVVLVSLGFLGIGLTKISIIQSEEWVKVVIQMLNMWVTCLSIIGSKIRRNLNGNPSRPITF